LRELRRRRLRIPSRPISERWGYDRGTPIDRHYIEQFLATCSGDIRGVVLEIKDAGYTTSFGAGVERVDVLDIDPGNREATIVADLAAADAIPDRTYDCIVLTQTLQYIPDLAAAVSHLERILVPGGVVLATAPGITRVNDDIEGLVDYWRFTEAAARVLFEQSFPRESVEVETFGSLSSACAFLVGLASEELTAAELAAHDGRYAVVVAVRARKA